MLPLVNYIVGKHTAPEDVDFERGAVILVDKPMGWTSFDVVNKIRSKIRHGLGIKKIKVGHAGTLDPLATGLLIICIGKLTKEIDRFQAKDKIYTGQIRLGAVTPTYDSEIAPTAFFSVDHITAEDVFNALTQQFTGCIAQVPPIYSAIKMNGQAAYALARKGKEVEMKSRTVYIYGFHTNLNTMPDVHFEVKCSKGTYIRSLAHDLGGALNSGGYLLSLRREAIGEFHVDQAHDIESVSTFIEKVTAT